MKKAVAFFAIVLMSAALPALAAGTYSRTGNVINFSFTDWTADMEPTQPGTFNYWRIELFGTGSFSAFSTCEASTTLSNSLTFSAPVTSEYPLTSDIITAATLVDCGNGFGASAPGGSGPAYGETIAPPSVGQFFTVNTGAAPAVLATVSAGAQDTGLLTVIAIAAGLPLAFYVARKVIELFPKKKA